MLEHQNSLKSMSFMYIVGQNEKDKEKHLHIERSEIDKVIIN